MVLPTIFVPDPVKPEVLPLGYCSEPRPDPERVCDIPDCIVTNDTEWVLFEGCSQSFHLACLREIQYCPLCQKLLQHKPKSLAITEKNVVLNPRIRYSQQNKESESDAPEGEVDSNGTLEDSNINIPECETSNVEANIVNINRGITSLAPTAHPSQKKRQQQQQQQQQQQTQMATEVVTVINTPHCKQCGHPAKGHKLTHH